jgi:hypothetical protein
MAQMREGKQKLEGELRRLTRRQGLRPSSSNSGSGGSSVPATVAGTYKFTVTVTASTNSSIETSRSVAVTVQGVMNQRPLGYE